MRSQGPHFSSRNTVQLKPMIQVQVSGRMASIGISDVVTASVYSEKTRAYLLTSELVLAGHMVKFGRIFAFFGGTPPPPPPLKNKNCDIMNQIGMIWSS